MNVINTALRNSTATPCQQGAREVINGTNTANVGRARIVVGLAAMLKVPLFAQDEGKKIAFTLADTKGKPNKAQADVIASEVFGLTGTTPDADIAKVMATFKSRSVFGAAAYIAANPALDIHLDGKHLKNVPVNIAVHMTDDDGKATSQGKGITELVSMILMESGIEKPNAKQIGERLNKTKVTCDGRKHPLYGPLPATTDALSRMAAAAQAQGLIGEKAKRTGRTTKKDSATFTRSLKMVSDVMASQMKDGDTKVALTTGLRTKLDGLRMSLEDYFKANPIKQD